MAKGPLAEFRAIYPMLTCNGVYRREGRLSVEFEGSLEAALNSGIFLRTMLDAMGNEIFGTFRAPLRTILVERIPERRVLRGRIWATGDDSRKTLSDVLPGNGSRRWVYVIHPTERPLPTSTVLRLVVNNTRIAAPQVT